MRRKKVRFLSVCLIGVLLVPMLQVLANTDIPLDTPSALTLGYQKTDKALLTNLKAKPMEQLDIRIDGKSVNIDAPILVQEGRVFLPIRAMGELLKVQIDYNQGSKVVIIYNEEDKIELPIGYSKAIKNEEDILPIDANNSNIRTFVYEETTYLPLRFVAEILDCSILYKDKKIEITTNNIEKTKEPEVVFDKTKMNPADAENVYNAEALRLGMHPKDLVTYKPTEAEWEKWMPDYKNFFKEVNVATLQKENDKVIHTYAKLETLPKKIGDIDFYSFYTEKEKPVITLNGENYPEGMYAVFKDGFVGNIGEHTDLVFEEEKKEYQLEAIERLIVDLGEGSQYIIEVK